MAGAVLIYDGDCAFCTRCARVAERLPTTAEVRPWQQVDLAGYGTTSERAIRELLWVRADGRIEGGIRAVAGFLADCGGAWRALGWLLRVPPVRWIGHVVYRVVANNRNRLPGGSAACALPRRRGGDGPPRA